MILHRNEACSEDVKDVRGMLTGDRHVFIQADINYEDSSKAGLPRWIEIS